MSKRSEATQRWREKTKKRVIEAMGGACVICGYNKCDKVMCLHHLDPSQKELSLGRALSNPAAWEKIVIELRKCILVCSNCHGEIHCNMVSIPDDAIGFNEDYAKYQMTGAPKCPVCNEYMPPQNKTCSRGCSYKYNPKVDWDSIDLAELLAKGHTYTYIGELLGVTAPAVSKRARKLGLKKPEPPSRRPARNELRILMETESFCAIGRQFGVSDNAVRKWARAYNLLPSK